MLRPQCLALGLVFVGGVQVMPQALSAIQDTEYQIASPDQSLRVSVTVPPKEHQKPIYWSAHFGGVPLIDYGELGLALKSDSKFPVGLEVTKTFQRSIDREIRWPFGKRRYALDRFNELRFRLSTNQDRSLEITFRCYNDAVAFRYVVENDTVDEPIVVTEERTSFQLAGNPTAYVQYLEHHRTSHEHPVASVSYRELLADNLLDTPFTAVWPNGTTMAITEAALRNYAGLSLIAKTSLEGSNLLRAQLSPRPDGTKVLGKPGIESPWRVVLVGKRPGELLESGTIFCLNEPPETNDFSWVQPDKLTFHWWNGDIFNGTPDSPALSFNMAKRYIDFCARNGIGIHSISSTEAPTTPWYHQSKRDVTPGDDTDVTRPRSEFEFEAIRNYARKKGIRLWTWVHQAALRNRVDEAFAAFSKMGWSGMMVDFFDHDDQDHVEFAESILRAAARHRILIHFHGIWKPTGLERTFPNLMNHEGALNLEYLKWSDWCTPEHNINMAFTRLLAGPIDYHLGGFRAVKREEFVPKNIAPVVLGTRCHMLAMYVCFDNPAPMLADYPMAYENQLGFEFIKKVPTWWDETQILEAEVGKLLVTARKKGANYYLGGMVGADPRNLNLALDFLPPGSFEARIWSDGDETQSNPNHLQFRTETVFTNDSLRVELLAGGGFVAQIVPKQH